MSDVELWRTAGAAARDAAMLLNDPIEPAQLGQVIEKSLVKLRIAVSAMECLRSMSVGNPAPVKGD